jgi:NADP-dependent 3-hydroxy acid dehydrogenase YdfG
MQIAGARALVTGATGGIGQAIARELAAKSCEVIITGRREPALQELAGELGPLARQAIPPMIERRSGHLVFISSIAGLVATSANGPLYTTTKWGLRGLGLALRQEQRIESQKSRTI